MRTTSKIILIIASIIAVLGLGLVGISLTMTGGDFSLLGNTSPLEEQTKQIDGTALKSLNLHIQNSDVVLVPSPDDQIHFTYFENERQRYSFTHEENEIIISHERPKHWWYYIGFNFDLPKPFTIAIPKDSMINFSFKTSNGSLDFQNLSLKGDLIAATSNGNIDASELISTGSFDFTTSNGKIRLEEMDSKTLSLKTKNGKTVLTDIHVAEALSAKSYNGEIAIEHIFAGKEIRLETSNGKITGSIDDAIRNFSIISSTSNGKNNLPENLPGGSKDLYVKTSNGTIDIEFNS